MADYPVFSGGPAKDERAGRLPAELRAYDLLDMLRIPYLRVDHPAARTIEDCGGVDRALGVSMCKNLFLTNAQNSRFYLLMIPGEKKFRTSVLSRQIQSSRLSFAKPEWLMELLCLSPGSVTALGLMNDPDGRVQLLIDRDVIAGREFVGCHPCVNTSSVRISVSDLMDVFLPFIGHEPVIVNL